MGIIKLKTVKGAIRRIENMHWYNLNWTSIQILNSNDLVLHTMSKGNRVFSSRTNKETYIRIMRILNNSNNPTNDIRKITKNNIIPEEVIKEVNATTGMSILKGVKNA